MSSDKTDTHLDPIISKDEWWRGAVIYQIYPRSFKDSNGDGIGDINGIIEKLDYIEALGVDAIWISPFFTSPMKDYGYDVSNYKDVDPMFGKLQDFDELISKAHLKGIKIIIDAVLSHTSDQHPWFMQSRENKENEKSDWYVWANPKDDGSAPNNWLSIFGGTAWHWEPRRRQYYLHNFLTSQPDLNFHNNDVREALLDVIRFWLEKGVDGFRLDTVNFYFHDDELKDNPPAAKDTTITTGFAESPYAYQKHLYDKSQPENINFLLSLRQLLDEYDGITTIGEIGDDERSLQLMSEYTRDGDKLHMAYTFDLLSTSFSSDYIKSVVNNIEQIITDGCPCWSVGNHDVTRVVSRWGENHDQNKFAKIIGALQLCLKGSYCIYQGEELGLSEAKVAFENLRDPFGITFWPNFAGRDGCRTPMPWDSNDAGGGFSESQQPWLPISSEHLAKSIDKQVSEPDSVLSFYKNFIEFKNHHPVLRTGNILIENGLPEGVIALTRHDKNLTLICFFNISDKSIAVDWTYGSAKAIENDQLSSGKIIDKKLQLPAYNTFFAYLT